jgi:hypothetical protein
MARSAAQSDFSVSRDPEVATAQASEASQASELATRWVMRLTVVLLLALAVLCAVGPHIASGE